MTKIQLTVEVDDADLEDPGHAMGITSEAYDRLTSYTEEHGAGALEWLGEVTDVVRVP